MEAGIRVGGVLDQHLVVRPLRDLIVVRLGPGGVGIDQAGRRRDDLPQVELDLLEQPLLVQFGVERFSLG